MQILSKDEKIKLLTTNLWSKKDVAAYYDYKLSAYQLNVLFKKIEVKTPFPKKTVYRDEIFRIMNTSFEEEYKNLSLPT